MNYEEKYEEALDNFKKIKAANKDNKELVDFIEYEYPELKESEDDRIKKFLIDLVNNWKTTFPLDLSKLNVLTWLEKKGELKSTKPAWSEEDERMLGKAISTIRYALSIPIDKEDDPCFVGSSTISWLKSIKERMKGE